MKSKLWKIKIHIISKEVFRYSLIAYLILLLTETFKEGFVSFFFNLNIVLAIVFVSGVCMVFTDDKKLTQHMQQEKTQKIRIRDIFYAIFLALGGAFLVLYKTIDLGIVAIIIAGITIVILVFLSLLILADKE